MSRRQTSRLFSVAAACVSDLLLIVLFLGLPRAIAQSKVPSTPDVKQEDLIRIQEVASVPAQPDTAYLLMTVQTERGELAQAIRENERQMQAFVTALKTLGVAESALKTKNFVVTPVLNGRGFNFARNLIITVEHIDLKPADEFAQLMARVQDVGARFGSDCITCIGSG